MPEELHLLIAALNLICGVVIGFWISSNSNASTRLNADRRTIRTIRTLNRMLTSIAKRVATQSDMIASMLASQSVLESAKNSEFNQAICALREGQQVSIAEEEVEG